MPDAHFADEYLASLYDIFENHGRADEKFYLNLVHSADRVLDVGCGTGTMLHAARDAGHRGRLVGIDPAAGMLAQGRRRGDIEWVEGYLPAAGFTAEFDLVYMTGHAFQVLLDDASVLELLRAVQRALVPGGHFAFESRNPQARAWEKWTPDKITEAVDPHGRRVRAWHEVEQVDGDLVTFTETYAVDGMADPMISRSTLRFISAEHLDHLLTAAGFAVDERYGNWDRCLFTPASPEIITVARPLASTA
ncbi:MAG: trans-aconitate 2-methyltransferase [Jatrophihabitans sp.]|uniref:class I SAM-dependent methyltransferase n=1 Tax=Jatrophihabitans sp. TaxID=1932789 RepID=UPI00390FEEF5